MQPAQAPVLARHWLQHTLSDSTARPLHSPSRPPAHGEDQTSLTRQSLLKHASTASSQSQETACMWKPVDLLCAVPVTLITLLLHSQHGMDTVSSGVKTGGGILPLPPPAWPPRCRTARCLSPSPAPPGRAPAPAAPRPCCRAESGSFHMPFCHNAPGSLRPLVACRWGSSRP